MIDEQTIIRIMVIMNQLKHKINPSYNNKKYQDWLMRNQLDKKMKFRSWVIEGAKIDIIKELDCHNSKNGGDE